MQTLTRWLLILGLIVISGCAATGPKVSVPKAVSDMVREDFGKDTTQAVWGELPETWPLLSLTVSWESKVSGMNAKFKLQETVRSLLCEQLAANSIALDDRAPTKLQVRIARVGVPKTGSTTGTMKLVKIRLAAWFMLPGQEQGAFLGTFDGIHVLNGTAKPNRKAYQVASKDAVSRLVRKLRVAKQKVADAS